MVGRPPGLVKVPPNFSASSAMNSSCFGARPRRRITFPMGCFRMSCLAFAFLQELWHFSLHSCRSAPVSLREFLFIVSLSAQGRRCQGIAQRGAKKRAARSARSDPAAERSLRNLKWSTPQFFSMLSLFSSRGQSRKSSLSCTKWATTRRPRRLDELKRAMSSVL